MEDILITEGIIEFKGQTFDFKFGKLEYNYGYFDIELYYEENSNLGIALNNENYLKFYEQQATIKGIDKNKTHYLLTCLEFINLISKPSGFAKLRSFGYLRTFPSKITDYNIPVDSVMYHIELEGFDIAFESKTAITTSEALTRKEISTEFEFSYTTAPFSLTLDNHGIHQGGILVTIKRNKLNQNVIWSFESYIKPAYRIPYRDYEKFNLDLIYYLSFVNGAFTRIRKEYFGRSYTLNRVQSEIETTYSYAEFKNEKFNNYLPIRDEFKRQDHQLYKLLACFQNYRDVNKRYNLNLIVSLLNDTNNAETLNQRFYCLVTALETFSKTHIKLIDDEKDDIIENKGLTNLMDDFKTAIKKRQKEINDPALTQMLTDFIMGLNRKRKNSVYKIFKLLEFAEIEMTGEIEKLVRVFRHTSVHEGEFGKSDQQRFNNYLLLDRILRDVILNMIKFKGIKAKASY